MVLVRFVGPWVGPARRDAKAADCEAKQPLSGSNAAFGTSNHMTQRQNHA